MLIALSLLPLLALPFLSTSALAFDEPSLAPPAPLENVTVVDHNATRVRFGIAATSSIGYALKGEQTAGGGGILGLALDLGAQFGDHVAVYAHAEANTALLANQASLYAVAEWTPLRRFSIGTGIGWDGFMFVLPLAGGNYWSGVSVPLILGLNLGAIDESSARHKYLRIGLECAAGIDPGSGAVGFHATIGVGKSWM